MPICGTIVARHNFTWSRIGIVMWQRRFATLIAEYGIALGIFKLAIVGRIIIA